MKHAEGVMNGAAERLRNKVLKEQPDQIEDDLIKPRIVELCLDFILLIVREVFVVKHIYIFKNV